MLIVKYKVNEQFQLNLLESIFQQKLISWNFCDIKNKHMGTSGLIRYVDGSEYRGQIKGNVPEGRGCLTFGVESFLQGEFVGGKIVNGKYKCQEFNYDGQFGQQSINGKGLLEDSEKTRYEGLFANGLFTSGTITKFARQNEISYKFSGNICNQKLKGTLQLSDNTCTVPIAKNRIKINGQFICGNLEGNGKYQFGNGDCCEGTFKKGSPHGQCHYKSREFELRGYFQGNILQGSTQIEFINKDRYRGGMKDSMIHGEGSYMYSDGTIIQGDFFCGLPNGSCKITYPKGGEIQLYQGQISDGIYNGIGVIYYSNGVIYKGFFENGAKHGYGLLIYGKSKYKCFYMMNQLMGELKLIGDD